MPPERLPELNEIITAAARDAGRDPGVGRWVDTLTTLHAESQMKAFVFWPSGDRERQSRVFAEQVVRAVRSAVAASA